MNISKSIKLALVYQDMTTAELAAALGTTRQRVYALSAQKIMTTETLERVAKALNYKTSEFIALGEE